MLIADAQQRFRSRPLAKQEVSIVSCCIIGIAGKESGHTVSINLSLTQVAVFSPTSLRAPEKTKVQILRGQAYRIAHFTRPL